jgi:hypothetical protein
MHLDGFCELLRDQTLAIRLCQWLDAQTKGKDRAIDSVPVPSNFTAPILKRPLIGGHFSDTSALSDPAPMTPASAATKRKDSASTTLPGTSTTKKNYFSIHFIAKDAISVPELRSLADQSRHEHVEWTNSKFGHFILFAGTEDCERYRVVRESELSPGLLVEPKHFNNTRR